MSSQRRNLLYFSISSFLDATALSYQAIINAQDKACEILLSFIESPLPCTKIAAKCTRLQVVKRALALINDSPTASISIMELCKHSFCSMRTLEYSFKEVLGTTPKKYVSHKKLQVIKATIESSPHTTVAEIAQQHGVINLGRFAKDFYTLFGKYPSQCKVS